MIRSLFGTTSLSLALFAGMSLSARGEGHEHKVGEMRDEALRISEFDHGMAGNVGETLLLFSMGSKSVDLVLRKGRDLTPAKFSRDSEGKLQAEFTAPKSGTKYVVRFLGANVEEQTLAYEITSPMGTVSATLEVEAEIENAHFQQPTMKLDLAQHKFNIKFDGESCWNYTSFIGLTLISAGIAEYEEVPAP